MGRFSENEPGVTYFSEPVKQEHIENKSEIILMKCSFCGNQSESKTELKNHVCSSNDLFCKDCGFLAGSTLTWKRHIEYSH